MCSSDLRSFHSPDDVLRVSGKTGMGVEALLDQVVDLIPAPTGDADAPAGPSSSTLSMTHIGVWLPMSA